MRLRVEWGPQVVVTWNNGEENKGTSKCFNLSVIFEIVLVGGEERCGGIMGDYKNRNFIVE